PTVDGERDDPRDAHRRQGPQCRPVEAEPARGHEPGAVRAAAPAKRVETKGMLERGLPLGQCARHRDLDLSQLLELTAPMSVVIAPLGVRLRPVRLAPAAREVEHRGLYPLEQVQAAPLRGFRQAAALWTAEDVEVVLARRGGAVDE